MITKDKFDAKYYLKKYPDVKKAGVDPWQHYVKYGFKEKRCYSADDEIARKFDSKFYLEAYPDVAKAKMDPLKHYLKYGRREGRRPFIKWDEVNVINNSRFFDREWYVRSYFNVRNSKLDPAVDYWVNGNNKSPGPYFNSMEYLLMNPDVAIHRINPLVHYEKYGSKERRPVQLCDRANPHFPEDASSVRSVLKDRDQSEKHIVSVVASYSGDGRIADYVIYLLNGLKEVSDYIIFVSDNPIFESELDKISNCVNSVIFERHEEYDFGSYKRGYIWLTENNILEEGDNLLFINDSCFGPLNSFRGVVDHFNSQECDFYGLSTGKFPIPFIQSFFYIFKEKVYRSTTFDTFIRNIKKEMSSAYVIFNYEYQFTQTLVDDGFTYTTYVSDDSMGIPTKYTYSLLSEYNYPLIKIKVLQGSTHESPDEIIRYIESVNPELAELVKANTYKKKQSLKHRKGNLNKYSLYGQYSNYINNKALSGGKVRIVFLVSNSSMFPGRLLMERMLEDHRFHVLLYIVPDKRFGQEKMISGLSDAYIELKKEYPFAKLAVDVKNDQIIEYKDVVKYADLVCYPSPYDLSFSYYNPPYAAELGIPSIHINYGFFRSKYDRDIYGKDNYNNFWRVFLETPLNYEEYAQYGYCDASNAVLTGYSKMDELSKYQCEQNTRERKRIIIAPHHSVEGGTNKILSLSNFQRYADFFLQLPQDYPEIDFVFRPHPMLFTVLRRKNQWGNEKVDQYLEQILSYSNVTYSTEGNYLKEFAESDGIIQDCGSFLVEYLYTDKPCCYMLKSPEDIESKFSELGKKCLENCYIAYNEIDIREYLDNVILQDIDYKKVQRHEYMHKEVMVNYPFATEKVYEHIVNCFWPDNREYLEEDSKQEKVIESEKHTETSEPYSNEEDEMIYKLQQENEKLAKLCSEQYQRIFSQESDIKSIQQQLDERETYITKINEENSQLLNSASWKITHPLRTIYFKLIGSKKRVNVDEM